MLLKRRSEREQTLGDSLAPVFIKEVSVFSWERALCILFLKGLNVLGWSRHNEIHVYFLELVRSFYHPLYLCVPVLGILEEKVVTHQDHYVLFIILGISSLLGEVNELGCVGWGIISVKIWVTLDSIELLVKISK